tara:strand:- start:440 stop:634 length:195 start_codon:yes stop_codon:yes gene_type:complete
MLRFLGLLRKKANNHEIKQWMNMSTEERYIKDIKEKELTRKRKKNLLNKIRREYDTLKGSKVSN